MSDKSNALIRQKALRAARAVTMGAALVAAGCASEDPNPSGGWEVGEESDAAGDASEDVADTAPDAVADAGPTCSGTSDQVCPEACSDWDDIDCCEEFGGLWEGEGLGCSIPGPFVPPSMAV